MKLLVTGTPGTGKTAVSKILSKHFKLKLINEKQFALKNGIGKWDAEENELVVPVKKLETALSKEILQKKNVLIEGHLLCETKLKIDFAVLLRTHQKVLETRLEQRGYNLVKVQDNVFAEAIDYCKKHLKKRYPPKKIIEVQADSDIKTTANNIIKEIKKRQEK